MICMVEQSEIAIGVTFGILAGIVLNLGLILQKLAVDKYQNDEKFMRSMVKNRMWLLGAILNFLLGSLIIPMIARFFIGQGLLQGLSAAGLIILAIGSVKIIKESLTQTEIIAIVVLMVGIVVLAFSALYSDIVEYDYVGGGFPGRLFIATAIILGTCGGLFLVQRYLPKYRGVSLAIIAGLLPALTNNFWLDAVLGTMVSVTEGTPHPIETTIFILGSVFVLIMDVAGMMVLTRAFSYGDANKLVPVSLIPLLITPMISFLWVYNLTVPHAWSVLFFYLGTAIILASTFVLARRQVLVEEFGKDIQGDKEQQATSLPATSEGMTQLEDQLDIPEVEVEVQETPKKNPPEETQ